METPTTTEEEDIHLPALFERVTLLWVALSWAPALAMSLLHVAGEAPQGAIGAALGAAVTSIGTGVSIIYAMVWQPPKRLQALLSL